MLGPDWFALLKSEIQTDDARQVGTSAIAASIPSRSAWSGASKRSAAGTIVSESTMKSNMAPAPEPVLFVHSTSFRYTGDADPSAPGGIAAIYRDLVADSARTGQVVIDVMVALGRGRHCLVLTQWTKHLELFASALGEEGRDPVILRGGMGAKTRAAAFARLDVQPSGQPLLVVATGPYAGEGFDCPVLDTLFLAAPVAHKGRLVQYAGRILRPYPGKKTAEIHAYYDIATGVLASSLAKRAPGYISLGFPDPRRIAQ